MVIPVKKLQTGFELPLFGLGTWQMGGRHDPDTSLDHQDILAIKTAIVMGITHIDTAEVYAAGHSEELIGEAIKEFDRSKLFLVSKTMHFDYKELITACEQSLQRLQTKYLDLYLLHRHSLFTPLSETMRAMDELVTKGWIKNIGVSNFSKESQAEAQSVTRNKIVTNQVYYNLINREPESTGLLEYCQKEDVFLTAYRPVEKGLLTTNEIPILKEMSLKYDKTPAQIAINWLTSQKNVVTLAKTSNLEHLKENLGAVGWEMSPEDVDYLRTEFPNQSSSSSSLPLG